MNKAISPGDRVEVIGGKFDGLRGRLSTGRPFDLLPIVEENESDGRKFIIIRGDDYKSYPMAVNDFKELRMIE